MSLSIKRLAGETLVYGASTMVGRLLNWLLMPFYIRVILPEEYGVIVNIYGLISVLLVLFTYGLETGFFRFARDGEEASVYSSSLKMLAYSSSLDRKSTRLNSSHVRISYAVFCLKKK